VLLYVQTFSEAPRSRVDPYSPLEAMVLTAYEVGSVVDEHEGLPRLVLVLETEGVLDVADTVELAIAVDAGPAEDVDGGERFHAAKLNVNLLVSDGFQDVPFVFGVRELDARQEVGERDNCPVVLQVEAAPIPAFKDSGDIGVVDRPATERVGLDVSRPGIVDVKLGIVPREQREDK